MLEKDPNKRYVNVNNLFIDLEALRNAHKAKAPTKYELGKSSIMRALNIEKNRHTELADRLKELEDKVEGAEASARVAWGAVIGAVLAALVFLVLWLTK
ncbi:MAG: hypothetical protein ACYTDT_04560, partial [Planctomycetota bacterium]|jgi:hypothetical protein